MCHIQVPCASKDARPPCTQHVPRARPERSPPRMFDTYTVNFAGEKQKPWTKVRRFYGRWKIVCGPLGEGHVTISMGSELICCSDAQHSISLCLPLLGFRSGFSRLFGAERVIFQRAVLTWVKLSVLCVSTSRTTELRGRALRTSRALPSRG